MKTKFCIFYEVEEDTIILIEGGKEIYQGWKLKEEYEGWVLLDRYMENK